MNTEQRTGEGCFLLIVTVIAGICLFGIGAGWFR